MAKLDRKNQLLFADTAASGQIRQYGSLAAGAPLTTKDVETLQALTRYGLGWSSAAVTSGEGNIVPALEDFNALFYLITYQLFYLFEQGIAEWDDGTTYYINSICRVGAVIYKSLTDSNLNQDPTTQQDDWVVVLNTGLTSSSTTPYTITDEETIIIDATAGDKTVNLISAAGIAGRTIQILKSDSSTNAVLIVTDGSETISGLASYAAVYQYEVVKIISDGTNWIFLEPVARQGVLSERTVSQFNINFGAAAVRLINFETIKQADFNWLDKRQIIDGDRVYLRFELEGGAGASTEVQVTIYDDNTSGGSIIFQHNFGLIGNQTQETQCFEVSLNAGNQTALDLSSTELRGINQRGAAAPTKWSLYAIQNVSPSGSYDIRNIAFVLKDQ